MSKSTLDSLKSVPKSGREPSLGAPVISHLGYFHTEPDSFCSGTKTIPDRASVQTVKTMISARFL